MYILCKNLKLKTLVTSLPLQHMKEVCVVDKHEGVTLAQDIECTCKIQWHYFNAKSILGLVLFVILK